jgi:hypothetical protein
MMSKSQRQLRDEAWLRLNTPDEHGQLPGQLPLGDPPPIAASEPVFDAAPAKCPCCDRRMTLDHGWTPNSESGRAADTYTIQCGFCGVRLSVTRETWEQLKTAIRERYLALNAPKPKPKPKRGRGAR